MNHESALPVRFILSIKPTQYFEQGPTNCGAYSTKAILSAYGVDDSIRLGELYAGSVSRALGIGLRRDYWIPVLQARGIEAGGHNAFRYSDSEKIALLKRLLAGNTPVMLRIGNGYILSQKYNPFFGKVVGHWITLWGYDGDVFYVYDSGVRRKHWNTEIPVGNTTRTSDEILRDWNFGAKQFWYWPIYGRETYQYISVKR